MKKWHTAFVLIFISALSMVSCSRIEALYARVVGGNIIYADTKNLPPAIFSHKNHLHARLQCADCHTKIFQKKKYAAKKVDANAMTMKNFDKGKYCGACHNGKKAFTVNGNCTKCHQST